MHLFSQNLKGLFAGLGVVFIWSGWIVISKYGLSNTLTVWDITGIRFLMASLVVAPFLYKKKGIVAKMFSYKVIVCSLSCGTLYLFTSLIGLEMSQASNTGIIVNGSLPIISAIILYFWKRATLSFVQYVGIGIIFVANYILIANASGSIFSVIWFLVSAFFLAFYSVSMNVWKVDLMTIVFSVPIINAVFFTPFWFFLPSQIHIAPIEEIVLQAVYQGIIVSLIALFLMSYSISVLGSVAAATVMAFVPVVAAFFAVYFLNESLTHYTWISAFLCTTGILFYASLSFTKKR